jgi:hypothetical protein
MHLFMLHVSDGRFFFHAGGALRSAPFFSLFRCGAVVLADFLPWRARQRNLLSLFLLREAVEHAESFPVRARGSSRCFYCSCAGQVLDVFSVSRED